MKLLAVVCVVLVAVSLTCTAGLSGYRMRLYKRLAIPATVNATTEINSRNATRLTASTARPRGCVTDKGVHVPLGQEITELEPGACRICRCRRYRLSCIHGDCLPPMCVDFTRPDCCYDCPNGQNCRLPSGEIISAPVVRGDMRCECPPQEYDFPGIPSPEHTTAICTPIPG